jgi:hypothetical protein
MVSDAMGFAGSTEGDASEPDGTPRKLLDTQHAAGQRLAAGDLAAGGHREHRVVVPVESDDVEV